MNRSNNPALSKKSLDRISAIESSSSATITGTSVKVFLLLLLSLSSGYFGWQAMLSNPTIAMSALMIASLFGFIIAILTVFKPNLSYMTGPLYALCQGYVLGAISQIYNTQFDGIVLQAITLTLALFIVSLVAFTSGLIKVTKKFRTGVIIATFGIALYYLLAFIFGVFGIQIPLIYDSGTFGIIFSLVVVFIATLNLMLDFDMIQKFEKQKAPKVFEWFGAFALMVTIIWLYTEVLRLLAKIRR